LPKALEPLKGNLDQTTVFSNLDHGVKGGHFAVHSFLSGVKHSQASSMPDGNLSLDQRAAEVFGFKTRFPSLVVGSENGLHGGCQMSWTRSGVRVPPIEGPKNLFRKLFIQEKSKNNQQVLQHYDLGKSILDASREDARNLGKRLNGRDRDKLDEYFTSIREVETGIQQKEKWHSSPSPMPRSMNQSTGTWWKIFPFFTNSSPWLWKRIPPGSPASKWPGLSSILDCLA
jgi:hypothetical protein